VCCLREYSLPLSVSKDEEHHLCAKSMHTSEWEKNCSFCKRILNVGNKSV
jgi:hypothetical protein